MVSIEMQLCEFHQKPVFAIHLHIKWLTSYISMEDSNLGTIVGKGIDIHTPIITVLFGLDAAARQV